MVEELKRIHFLTLLRKSCRTLYHISWSRHWPVTYDLRIWRVLDRSKVKICPGDQWSRMMPYTNILRLYSRSSILCFNMLDIQHLRKVHRGRTSVNFRGVSRELALKSIILNTAICNIYIIIIIIRRYSCTRLLFFKPFYSHACLIFIWNKKTSVPTFKNVNVYWIGI